MNTPGSTISPKELSQKFAQKFAQKNIPSTNDPDPLQKPNDPPVKVYQFLIAPCSYHFSGEDQKTSFPDGICKTSDPKKIRELDAKVKQNLLRDVTESKVVQEAFQKPVEAVSKLHSEQSGE